MEAYKSRQEFFSFYLLLSWYPLGGWDSSEEFRGSQRIKMCSDKLTLFSQHGKSNIKVCINIIFQSLNY